MTTHDSHGLRLMCIHAHPDDEASKGAGVMARYVDEGAQVEVVTCTGGERGDIVNPTLENPEDLLADLTRIRRHEMAKAAQILGVDHHWLGYEDSGYPEGIQKGEFFILPEGCFARQPLEVTVGSLVHRIRQQRPHVLTTYDENGGYPHPDHVMCHRISMAAFDAAGDPDQFPDAGLAWQPATIFYNATFSVNRIRSLHQYLLDKDRESPFTRWLQRIEGTQQRTVHAEVPCGDYYSQREAALKAHETQVDPNGAFFALTPEELAEVAPNEDFELGASYLLDGNTIVDDLFAGVRNTPEVETGWGSLRSAGLTFDATH